MKGTLCSNGRLCWREALSSLRRACALGVVLALLVSASACELAGGASSSISASAVFSDVGDLQSGAPVQMADVKVGKVTSISLDGTQALVTMSLSRTARVPQGVTAELRRTAIFGQRFIELTHVSREPGIALLKNGARISHTTILGGIQELVSAGGSVFSAINSSDLASAVAAGAQGFGGEGARLHSLLSNFASVMSAYASRDATIRSLVASMDQLSASLAPSSGANAQAISNLAATSRILANEANRFESLLQALNNLSLQGRSLLELYFPQITTQLKTLYTVSKVLATHQASLAGLIQWIYRHDLATKSGTVNNYQQILNDLIVCGLANGGSNPSQPSTSCYMGGSKRRAQGAAAHGLGGGR